MSMIVLIEIGFVAEALTDDSLYNEHLQRNGSPSSANLAKSMTKFMRDFGNDSTRATVFVVDDDPSFLRAMKRLLHSAGYLVETFESAQELLQRKNHLGYGCLIADLRMPGDSGLDLQAKLNQQDYTLPIIFMTGAGDTESGVSAMKHGAVDFLPKPVEKEVLLSVIEEAIEKDRQARAQFDRQVGAKQKVATLTEREKEIMSYVVTGMPNKEIAYQLRISEKTVKAHRGQAMKKSGAKSIVDLATISQLAGAIR
jgi:FixJ family two-component response regulator